MKKFGADYVLDSTGEWEKEAAACTPNKRGVDVVLDPLGLIGRSLKCIRWDGRLVVIGFAALKGPEEFERILTNYYLVKNVSVTGLFWGRYATEDPEAVVTVWNALLDLIAQGKVKPMTYTDKQFKGLDDVAPALNLLASGEAWGKIVVDIVEARDSKL